MKKTAQLSITLLALIAIVGCTSQQAAEKIKKTPYQRLYNGKDLTGWVQKGGEARYFVENDCIVGETVNEARRNSFLCTEKTFCDFVLDLEFKVDSELNSGVQIRSETRPGRGGGEVVFGYQVEIDASEKPFEPNPERGRPANLDADGVPVPPGRPRLWTGGIYDEARRGWLYSLHKDPKARAALKQNLWNHLRIEAIGDSIKTWVNGVAAANLKDSETGCGLIGLQVHRLKEPLPKPLQIRFRKIRIKDLSAN